MMFDRPTILVILFTLSFHGSHATEPYVLKDELLERYKQMRNTLDTGYEYHGPLEDVDNYTSAQLVQSIDGLFEDIQCSFMFYSLHMMKIALYGRNKFFSKDYANVYDFNGKSSLILANITNSFGLKSLNTEHWLLHMYINYASIVLDSGVSVRAGKNFEISTNLVYEFLGKSSAKAKCETRHNKYNDATERSVYEFDVENVSSKKTVGETVKNDVRLIEANILKFTKFMDTNVWHKHYFEIVDSPVNLIIGDFYDKLDEMIFTIADLSAFAGKIKDFNRDVESITVGKGLVHWIEQQGHVLGKFMTLAKIIVLKLYWRSLICTNTDEIADPANTDETSAVYRNGKSNMFTLMNELLVELDMNRDPDIQTVKYLFKKSLDETRVGTVVDENEKIIEYIENTLRKMSPDFYNFSILFRDNVNKNYLNQSFESMRELAAGYGLRYQKYNEDDSINNGVSFVKIFQSYRYKMLSHLNFTVINSFIELSKSIRSKLL